MYFEPLALLPALFGTAWLLVRRLAPAVSPAATGALTLAGSVLLVMGLPAGLHYGGIPVTAGNLAWLHGLVFGVVWVGTHFKRPALGAPRLTAGSFIVGLVRLTPLWPVVFVLLLLLFPFTHLAGIDTYRWNNLAASVIREQNIPWLIHPLGLLGYTPYAYPSAHPLILTTVRLLSGLGVDGSWYLVSLFTAALSVCSMTWLMQSVLLIVSELSLHSAPITAGTAVSKIWSRPSSAGRAQVATIMRRLIRDRRDHAEGMTEGRVCNGGLSTEGWALAAGCIYVMSPVSMRYTHWATGRGLFMALLPLALMTLTESSSRRAWAIWVVTGLLLVVSHKAGWVAVPLLAAGRLLGRPAQAVRPVVAGPLALALLVGLSIGVMAIDARSVFAIGWRPALNAVSRLGWLAPAILPALWYIAGRSGSGMAVRRLSAVVVLSMPLIFLRDMYGALIAAAPVTLLVVLAMHQVSMRRRRRSVGMVLIAGLTLSLLGALTVVVVRSRAAMPSELRAAAAFLDRHDPHGPYRLEGPGRTVGQVRAYVGGSPAIAHYGSTPGRLAWPARPDTSSPGAWIAAMRRLVKVEVPDMVWVDRTWPVYHIVIKGSGRAPPGSMQLYNQDGVAIYGPVSPPHP